MFINVHSVHFTADQKLIGFIEQKFGKLSKFSDRITEVEVFLRLDNGGAAVKDKVVEAKVTVPGHTFFAKQTSKSFENSTMQVGDVLKTLLAKHKERIKE